MDSAPTATSRPRFAASSARNLPPCVPDVLAQDLDSACLAISQETEEMLFLVGLLMLAAAAGEGLSLSEALAKIQAQDFNGAAAMLEQITRASPLMTSHGAPWDSRI